MKDDLIKLIKETVYEATYEGTKSPAISISKFMAEFKNDFKDIKETLNKIETKVEDHTSRIDRLEQVHCDEEKHRSKGFVIVGWILGVTISIGTGLVGYLMLADKEQKQEIHADEIKIGSIETDVSNFKNDIKEIKADIKTILKEIK